jgi:hypothetical protein
MEIPEKSTTPVNFLPRGEPQVSAAPDVLPVMKNANWPLSCTFRPSRGLHVVL